MVIFTRFEWLNQAIYLFHDLPVDAFTSLERQNVCHILKQLNEVFVEINPD